jgi:histidinol dehydrogenase
VRTLRYPSRAFDGYLRRLPRAGRLDARRERAVRSILEAVRREGDRALLRFTARFDGVRLTAARLKLKPAEVEAAARRAEPSTVAALRRMAARIEAFHRRQRERGFRLADRDGTLLEEVATAIDSVGLYVPGGAGAYPSTVLMNAIPARVAGVPRVVVVTPPRTLESHPAVAAALLVAGLQKCVYRVGGAQAVAALAFGTASVPAVSKIVGPGNAFVAAAKRQVRGTVDVDMDAGPSEVVVLADDTARPEWVAADLLAQAEHGSGEETVALVTTSDALAAAAARLLKQGLDSVANARAASRALARYAAIVKVDDVATGVAAVNALAPEHAQVMTRDAAAVAARLIAGAVFVGPHAPVAVGDYGIGPNHVLPTGGAARRCSPLSVRDFMRRQSRVRLTRAGLRRVAADVVRIAEAEGFVGHARSVLVRLA